jgi:hypothetical protein
MVLLSLFHKKIHVMLTFLKEKFLQTEKKRQRLYAGFVIFGNDF